ncbi:hypothetical protein [Streptomyces sp. NPDC006879]|uniref:hypothetical protein n=1 Tax=Streptomyces sp. NPDC006879 TaxID=3364767 RepID=UPI0036A1157B
MAPRSARAEVSRLADLLEGAGTGQSGALWRLRTHQRQLDSNIVRLPAGAEVAEHVETHLDVVMFAIRGSARITLDGRGQDLEPGSVIWLPHGVPRALSAGAEGLVFLTVHRRRRGMTIGGRSSSAQPPNCTLHRVCPRCHRHAIEFDAAFCSRCGTGLPTS